MNNQTYLDSGFDKYFQRELVSITQQTGSDISQFDFESQYAGLPASLIQGGIIGSRNGRLTMDTDEEKFVVSDGLVERVRLGKLDDGSYGIQVKDANDNTLIHISGNTNVIKSPDNSLELNFDNTQLLVRDAGGLVKVLLGKDLNGF